MLWHVVDRVGKAKLVDDIVICSPHKIEDIPDGVKEFVYSEDESDVLARYWNCYLANPCDYVLRITSDCPMLDPHLIDAVIHHGIKNRADYCSNVLNKSFPDGVDCELISKRMLSFLHATVNSRIGREHVTLAARENKGNRDQFNMVSVESRRDYSDIKWSVDTHDDLERVRGFF